MATPRNVSRTTQAGAKLRAGRFTPAYINLIDQIAAAAPGSWVKVNLNRYSDAWPSNDFLAGFPTFDAQPSSPKTIINAWSSFAWDDDQMRLVLFGGGHANSSSSEVYEWRGDTQAWRLAFHTTQYEKVGTAGERSVAGSTVAPISAHTYSNQVWLEKLQRFITFGGAAHSGGAQWVVSDSSGNILRNAGPFVLDMTLAGQGYVSGPTGSNVKRVGTSSAGVDLPGANAWSLRDYWSTEHPVSKPLIGHLAVHRNGTVVHRVENNHDTLYVFSDSGNAGSAYLYRIEIVDGDYRNDIITMVGAGGTNGMIDCQAALDPDRNVFVVPAQGIAGDVLQGWNLATAGQTNYNFRVAPAGLGGVGADEFKSVSRRLSLIYDERRKCFVGWENGKTLWKLKAPATGSNFTTGWTIEKIVDETLPVGPAQQSVGGDIVAPSGVVGKWKRSKRLDVYVGLQHITEGHIWLYKPHDWLDPRGI